MVKTLHGTKQTKIKCHASKLQKKECMTYLRLKVLIKIGWRQISTETKFSSTFATIQTLTIRTAMV